MFWAHVRHCHPICESGPNTLTSQNAGVSCEICEGGFVYIWGVSVK